MTNSGSRSILTVPHALLSNLHNPVREELLLPPFTGKETASERISDWVKRPSVLFPTVQVLSMMEIGT